MKLRLMIVGVLALGAVSCVGADDAVDQKEGASVYVCGGGSLSTPNPSMQNVMMHWTLPGVSWDSNIRLLTDTQGKAETRGLLFFEIDRPTQLPGGTWPLFTSGVRVNGSSIQAIMPAETAGNMYIFEGQTTVSGPFPGGSVSMSGVVYNGKHQLLGSFSTAVGVSGGSHQFLTGIVPGCPSTAPPTLHFQFFRYNLEVCCGVNGPTWIMGTVSGSQNGAYAQLKLSNPNFNPHETWYGDAACVIDPNGLLQCNMHTGQDTFTGDVGDPIWFFHDMVNGYMYPYNREWDYEATSDGAGGPLYLDIWGY